MYVFAQAQAVSLCFCACKKCREGVSWDAPIANIAFLGCCTDFSHVTVCKMTTSADSTSYGSLVAATSLNTGSACKLSHCHLSHGSSHEPHSSLARMALQVQSMKSGIWTMK